MNKEDFKKVCRLCLQKLFDKISIFSELDVDSDHSIDIKPDIPIENDDSIAEMITFCTGMNLSPEDELPKFICISCSNNLQSCTKFLRICLSSRDVLENVLTAMQCKVESNDNFESPSGLSESEDENMNSNDEGTEDDLQREGIEECVGENFSISDNMDSILTVIKVIDESDEDPKIGGANVTEKKKNRRKPKNDLRKMTSDDTDKVDQSSNDDSESKTQKHSRHREGQCPICGKMFRRISSHMAFHSGVRKHKCSVCDKTFRLTCNLKQHMLVHLDTRPHKCKYCDKGFNSKQSLKAHEIHHSGEKNYECNICGRKFAYPTTLRYHKKVHNQIRQHKCDQCGREFITKHALKTHYRIHTGEKPYECNECGKRFNNTGGLYLHQKTHTQKLSFHCEKCNSGFVYKSTYTSHLKRYHGNEDDKNVTNA